jgi:TPR repeat protein
LKFTNKARALLLSLIILFLAGIIPSQAGDGLAPLSISVFGLYASPVQPASLSLSNYDGAGFDLLAEYQPTRYASVGLGYEKVVFYGGPGYYAGSMNLEGRFFPMAGMKLPWDPYVSGGAGLNLASGTSNQWGGVAALKAGLGTKVGCVGPMSLDFAVEGNWLGNNANYLQYVDFRVGVDYAIPFEAPPTPTPTPSPTSVATAVNHNEISPTPTVTLETPKYLFVETNTPTPSPVITPTSSSELLLETASAPAHSRMKAAYLKGVKALKAHNYPTAILYFKKAVKINEKVPYYYYSEAYANLGVIYQFHSKVKSHLKLALGYYQAAAKIDPDTLAVKKYYKKLKAQLAKPKGKARSAANSSSATDASSPASAASSALTAPAASAPAPAGSAAPTPSAGKTSNTDISM